MTSSYCMPFSRNTTSKEGPLIHNSELYLPKFKSFFFSYENPIPKKSSFSLKSSLRQPSILLLTLKPYKFIHPFAEVEGEGVKELNVNKHQTDEISNDDLPGMARAFHRSSRTASAISACIALAAVKLPFTMKYLGSGFDLKTKLLSYTTLLFGFYMAWNIVANDVVNAMGTSVGTGALTLRQPVLTASVLEFYGALLIGTRVQYNAERNSCC